MSHNMMILATQRFGVLYLFPVWTESLNFQNQECKTFEKYCLEVFLKLQSKTIILCIQILIYLLFLHLKKSITLLKWNFKFLEEHIDTYLIHSFISTSRQECSTFDHYHSMDDLISLATAWVSLCSLVAVCSYLQKTVFYLLSRSQCGTVQKKNCYVQVCL